MKMPLLVRTKILQVLDLNDLCNAVSACEHLREVVGSPVLWRQVTVFDRHCTREALILLQRNAGLVNRLLLHVLVRPPLQVRRVLYIALASMSHIQRLHLSVDMQQVDFIANMKQLKQIHIWFGPNMNPDQIVESLAKCSKLQAVAISGPSQLAAGHAIALATLCPQLIELDFVPENQAGKLSFIAAEHILEMLPRLMCFDCVPLDGMTMQEGWITLIVAYSNREGLGNQVHFGPNIREGCHFCQ